MNSGIERAALMISEEKHQQDSRKSKITIKQIHFSLSHLVSNFDFMFIFVSIYLEIGAHFSRFLL